MLKKLTLYVIALMGTMVLFNSCKKEYESIESIDDAKIQAYIKKNNLTMTKDPSGFYYQTVSDGTGPVIANKDSIFYTLSVNSLEGVGYYNTAAYANEGTYFGYMYPTAYRIALTGAKRGAKVRVILPSYLAYGKNGTTNVPGNEVVVTDVTTRIEDAQWKIDDKTITDFLTAKNITGAVKGFNRVYYKVGTTGTGDTPIDLASTVVAKYTGRLLNGAVFDSTGETTVSYTATGQFIPGWDVLLGMRAGTKVRIFIPSDLAYGIGGNSAVPPNAVLDFDIEIVSVTN